MKRVLRGIFALLIITSLVMMTHPTNAWAQDGSTFGGTWVGKSSWYEGSAYQDESLEITFHTEGLPPQIKMVSHKWGMERPKEAKKFEVGNSSVKIWIDPDHPKSRQRIYDLTLTEPGVLKGTLSGVSRDGLGRFSNEVLLKKK